MKTMPHIPKKKIVDLIDRNFEGYQSLLTKRVVDVKQQIDEATMY
jgi:hypothetical protein